MAVKIYQHFLRNFMYCNWILLNLFNTTDSHFLNLLGSKSSLEGWEFSSRCHLAVFVLHLFSNHINEALILAAFQRGGGIHGRQCTFKFKGLQERNLNFAYLAENTIFARVITMFDFYFLMTVVHFKHSWILWPRIITTTSRWGLRENFKRCYGFSALEQ